MMPVNLTVDQQLAEHDSCHRPVYDNQGISLLGIVMAKTLCFGDR